MPRGRPDLGQRLECGRTEIDGSLAAAGGDLQAVPEISAATLLQPRVRTGDPAFGPLYAAVRARRAVTFDYRKDPGSPAEHRRVQPFGLVSFRGRWYVIGHDEKRGDRRTFRLSRIAGPVKTVGRAGAVSTPDGIDLLAEVAATVERPADRIATVLLRAGRATLKEQVTGHCESGRCCRCGLDELSTVHSERRIGFHILMPLRGGSFVDVVSVDGDEWSTVCKREFDANQRGT